MTQAELPLDDEGDAAPYPGLKRAGARLPVDEYVRRVWDRRFFVAAYSTASNSVGYERSFLGQAWQLLTPLLNIAVYYLIFGLLLHTSRGVPNFIAYLTVGVFVFGYMQASLVAGSKSITGNLGLVRALQFPRAVLPLSTTLIALLQLFYSLVVMVPILLLSGIRPSLRWLEIVPAIGLQTMFCLALALITARAGAKIPDTAQILPFFARVWMYMSGVMFSVSKVTVGHPAWVSFVLTNNPGYVYLQISRAALIPGTTASFQLWLTALAWAVGLLAVAFLYFWRDEESYGNV